MDQKELNEQLKMQQQVEALELQAKQLLDSQALQRYGNIKLAYPDKALRVAMIIVQAQQMGTIKNKLTDNEFKELLAHMQEPKKRFQFTRK